MISLCPATLGQMDRKLALFAAAGLRLHPAACTRLLLNDVWSCAGIDRLGAVWAAAPLAMHEARAGDVAGDSLRYSAQLSTSFRSRLSDSIKVTRALFIVTCAMCFGDAARRLHCCCSSRRSNGGLAGRPRLRQIGAHNVNPRAQFHAGGSFGHPTDASA